MDRDPPLHVALALLPAGGLASDLSERLDAQAYVHPVTNSPLEVSPLLEVSNTLRLLNPAIFVGSLLFALAFAFRPGPLGMVALSFLYFTAIHVVLQAEPRYSVPYRPVQLLLVVSAVTWAVTSLGKVLREYSSPRT